MSRFEIVTLEEVHLEEAWQAWVSSAPNGSLYHTLEWRDVLLSTFKHRSWYLMARREGATHGVLPLVEMRSLLFGRFFVSLPFVNNGGILADTPECEAALAAAAAALAAKRRAQHIELRHSSAVEALAKAGWTLRQHKAALVISLNPDPTTHWFDLSSRLRGKVRKAENSGATFSACGPDGLNDFYRVFSLNMRDLGTPVYSPVFFQNIVRFASDATVLLIHRDGQPLAAAIALRRGTRIELPWICSDYSQSRFHGNEYLYWKAIEWACKSNARELDLGRSSPDAGTYRFKMQWNPKVYPLYWYYWLRPGISLPELNPNNPKYRFAIRLWKKMPLALANRVGPWIVRNIP
jgi:serine/alanine adding enzyme